MLHSVVGLAAVLTSVGSVLGDISHVSTLHLVTAYLGVVIGEQIKVTVIWHAPLTVGTLIRWYHIHWFYCCIP